MTKYLSKGLLVAAIAFAATACDNGSDDKKDEPPPAPDYAGMLSVTSANYGTTIDSVEIAGNDFALQGGKTYDVSFTVAADQAATVTFKAAKNGPDYDTYFALAEPCAVTAALTTCSATGLVASADATNARLVIDLGTNPANTMFYFKNASVMETGTTTNLLSEAVAPMNDAAAWAAWPNNDGEAPALAVVPAE